MTASRLSRLELSMLSAVIIMAALLAFYRLDARHFWGIDDEAKWALTAKAGLWPANPGQGAYPMAPWMIKGAFWLSGQESEQIARIPSALLSLAGLGAVGAMGYVACGPMAGIMAMGALGSSVLFSFYARTAAPEMAANFFCSWAMFCLLLAVKEGGSRNWIRLFCILLGLSFHAGGAVYPAIALGGAIYTAHNGRLGPDGHNRLFDRAGILILFLAIFPIFVYASNQPLSFYLGERRMEAFWSIKEFSAGILLFFPWILAFPPALRHYLAMSDGFERAPADYFIGALMTAMTFAAAGYSHPILLLTPMALMIGLHISYDSKQDVDTGSAPSLWTAPIISNGIVMAPLIIFIGLTIAPRWSAAVAYPPLISSLTLLAAIYISHKSMSRFVETGETWGMWTAAMAASFSFLIFFHAGLAPAVNRSASHKVFFRQAASLMGEGARVCFYKYDSAQARYYLDVKPKLAGSMEELAGIMSKIKAEEGTIFILTDMRGKPDIEKAFGKKIAPQSAYIDSYFVPPMASMESERLLIYKYAPHEKAAAPKQN